MGSEMGVGEGTPLPGAEQLVWALTSRAFIAFSSSYPQLCICNELAATLAAQVGLRQQ